MVITTMFNSEPNSIQKFELDSVKSITPVAPTPSSHLTHVNDCEGSKLVDLEMECGVRHADAARGALPHGSSPW